MGHLRGTRRPGGQFGRLWAASTLSSLGEGVTLTAAPLLAASLTRDPARVAWLAAAQQLPWMLLALPGGVIVDRVRSRTLMTAVCLLRAGALGALGLAVATGHASLPLLYATAALVGCAAMLFDNAATVAVPAVVARSGLERANGRLVAARSLSQSLVAAPLAGWLFAVATWSPFAVDAAALAAAATLTAALTAAASTARSGTRVRSAVAGGVRWLWHHPALRVLALTVAVSNVALGASLSLLVLVARDRLGLGPVGYGLLLTAAAAGGIVGGLTAHRLVAAVGPGPPLRIGLVVEALVHAGLASVGDAVAAGLVLAVMGLHFGVFSTISASLRQTLAPEGMLGRVHSAYRLLSNGGLFLGATLGGVAGRYLGLTTPFWCAAATAGALSVAAWRALDSRRLSAADQARRRPGRADA